MTTCRTQLPSIPALCTRTALACLAWTARSISSASARALSADPSEPSALFAQARDTLESIRPSKFHAGHANICIVDLQMPQDSIFTQLASINHRNYAKRHSYSHYGFEGRMSGEMFVDAEQGPLTDKYGGGLFWQELSALAWVSLQKNKDGSDACQWMMWMDNDAVYTNFKVTIESLVRHFAETGAVSKDAIFARELTPYPGSFVNAGVFLVKNSPGGREFLSEVADSFDYYGQPGKFDDQGAIQGYIFAREITGLSMDLRPEIEGGLRANMALVPQRVMNAFMWTGDPTHDSFRTPESEWQPCDWVLHIASRGPEERAKIISERSGRSRQC